MNLRPLQINFLFPISHPRLKQIYMRVVHFIRFEAFIGIVYLETTKEIILEPELSFNTLKDESLAGLSLVWRILCEFGESRKFTQL